MRDEPVPDLAADLARDAGVACPAHPDGDHAPHFTNWPYPWRCSACAAVLYLSTWKWLEEPALNDGSGGDGKLGS